MNRWALATAAGLTLAALVPAFPAAAATPTTIELVSGAGPVGSPDPDTDMSLDGGTTYQDAVIVAPHFLYSALPGAGWVSDADAGLTRQLETTLFRRSFTLPAGTTGAEITVCVHADNAARISLNGAPIGAQPEAPIVSNFQDPAECFTGVPQPGDNVLEFTVRNLGAWMGLNYRATVTYEERVNVPPVLQLPADITVNATSPQGAAVDFTVTATDDTGAQVSCDREPGSTFAIGATTVTCTATDDDGATASGSFTVTVRGAGEQLDDLLAAVSGVGPGNSLAAKIRSTISLLPAGGPAVCEPLNGFIAEVRAQSGKQVPAAAATKLIADATRIGAVLGCR